MAAELPIGYYTVRFEAAGMAQLERQRVKVDVGGETRLRAQAVLSPVDALAEFSVQTQSAAEYGRNSGAVVNAVVKSEPTKSTAQPMNSCAMIN